MVRPPRLASRSLARTCTWSLSLALGLGLAFAIPGPARAQPADAPELRWQAPTGCPTQQTVEARLDRVLGQVDPQRREALRLRARAQVTQTGPARFSLDLEITTSEGVSARHVDAATCEELADATTLLISMVDPAAAAEAEQLKPTQAELPLEPQPAPEQEQKPKRKQRQKPKPVPDPEPAAEGQPQPRPERDATGEAATHADEPDEPGEAGPSSAPPSTGRKTPLQGLLGVDLLLGRAGLPSFGAGFELRVGALRRHLRGELFARYHLPRTQTLDGLDELDAGVRYQLGAGGLRGCGLGSVGERAELFGCLGAELGAMHGVGLDLPVSASHTGLWAAVLVTPGVALRLTPWLALVARGDLGIALARPRFSVRNYGDAHRAPPVTFVLGLGVEVRLPPSPALRATKKFRDGSARSRAIPPGAP